MERGKLRIPADLWIEDVVAIADTREQLPLNLTPMRSERATLGTGDYTVAGLEDLVAVERKTLVDMVACCGRERQRFEREIRRLLGFPSRLLVVESSWTVIQSGEWRGQVCADTVLNSLLSWAASGLPFVLAGDREQTADIVRRFLFGVARRNYRHGRKLILRIGDSTTAKELGA